MNNTIQRLMRVPATSHDTGWLQTALQAAIQLELSTLPPYLSAMFSMPDQTSAVYKLVNDIVFNEMTHFGLACNLLATTGEQPTIATGYRQTTYPGPLPGGVRPKCNPEFFPCDPDFEVVLGFSDLQSFAKMCMQIEYPEAPAPRHLLSELVESYPSIGEFYDAILNAFRSLGNQIPYPTGKQLVKASMSVFVVDGLPNALKAISLIKEQGEGASKYPYYGDNQLSHFYAFGEIFYGKAYVFDPVTQVGDWTGAPIPSVTLLPMTPIPLGGYPNPPAAVLGPLKECDQNFSDMLNFLDDAWANGNAASLSKAIGSMGDLDTNSRALLGMAVQRIDAPGIYGPQFRLV